MAEKTPVRPDIKTFLSDPAYQSDRDLFEALIENFLTRKEEEAKRKREEEEKYKPTNIFDRMFGNW